jgi:hypothetical protein
MTYAHERPSTRSNHLARTGSISGLKAGTSAGSDTRTVVSRASRLRATRCSSNGWRRADCCSHQRFRWDIVDVHGQRPGFIEPLAQPKDHPDHLPRDRRDSFHSNREVCPTHLRVFPLGRFSSEP